MANKFPLTVNTSTKVIEELSSGDNLNLSGSGIYDGASLGNTGDFLRKKSGGGVEWSSVPPGSIPVPVASETTLGGIKIGQNLTINSSGVLSANLDCYTLPIASSNILGGIKIGSGLSINPITGVVTAQQYSLPIASGSTLGGIKVGVGLSISGDGTLNVLNVSVPVATNNVLGGVKIGNDSGLVIDSTGNLSVVGYTLPTASTSTLGGVKVDGTTITITNGIITATTGGVGTGLSSRTTTEYTTPTLATDGADSTASFTGFKSYALFKIQTSGAAWVVLYTNSASRSSDASRPESIDPLPGSGVLAEVITTGAQTVVLTPGTFGFNDDATPSTTIYAKIVNKGASSAAITVTLTLLKLEL